MTTTKATTGQRPEPGDGREVAGAPRLRSPAPPTSLAAPHPATSERDYPQSHVAAGLIALVGCGFVAISIFSSDGVSFVTAVLGLGLGVVAAITRGRPEDVVSITVDEGSGDLRLHLRDRSTATLPRATIDRITVERRGGFQVQDQRTPHVRCLVVVHRRDGGRIEPLAFALDRETEARALVDDLQRDLEAAPPHDDEPPSLDGILARARTIPGVSAHVEGTEQGTYRSTGKGGALVLSWKTPVVYSSVFIGLSTTLGMAFVLAPFADTHLAARIAHWALMALSVFVVLTALTIGGSTTIRVDDAHLVVAQTRLGRTRARTFALADVQAIDYALRERAGRLVVRLASDVAPEGATPSVAMIRQLVGRQIPTGRMTLPDCIAVDLVLSAEVARRKGLAAGEV